MKTFTKKQVLALLALLLLAAGLRVRGLSWGVPDATRQTPLYVDEYSHLWMLSRMQPSKGDFNPHHFIDPTLTTYQYGALLKALSVIGVVKISADKDFYMANPHEYAKLFITGRAIMAVYGIATLLMIFVLGFLLAGRFWAGFIGAIGYALSPLPVISCYVIDIGIPVSFWLALSFLCLYQVHRTHNTRWLWASAFVMGLSFSTKYTTAPLFLGFLYTLVKQKAPIRFYVQSVWIFLIAFLLGTPYALLDYKSFLSIFFTFTGQHVVNLPTTPYDYWIMLTQYGYAIGWILTVASLIGLALALRGRDAAAVVAVLFLVPYLFLLGKSELHVTRYLNESLPFLLPFVSVLGLWMWEQLPKRVAIVAIAAITLSAAPSTAVLAHALWTEKDPRDQASDWILQHIPERSLIALQETPNFKSPACLYMLYWKGSRYNERFIHVPEYRLSLWNTVRQEWPSPSPEYWVEFDGYPRGTPKRALLQERDRDTLSKMRTGYTPVASFEHTLRFGPMLEKRPRYSGVDWLQFFPRLVIYKRNAA